MRKQRLHIYIFSICLIMLIGIAGCKHKSTIKAQISKLVPKGVIVTKISVAKAELKGHFNYDGQTASITCNVSIKGKLNGQPYEENFDTTVSAKGCECDDYKLKCGDPLVVQFPSDASNFVGTFDDGGFTSGSLIITNGLTKLPISPGKDLFAEVGHQIVVTELPDGVPDGEYTFALTFDLASSREIEVKPIILGEVAFDNTIFFPHLLPNVTSFSDISPILIPVSDSLVDILPPLDGVEANNPIIVCPIADQLHVVGEESNQIAVGSTATITAAVQNEFLGVANLEAVFSKLIGDFRFTSGHITPNGQATTLTTNLDGIAIVDIVPDGTGLSLLKVTVPGTSLSAFYLFFGQ